MVPSHFEISRGALAFVDQFARVTTGFEVATLAAMAFVYARSLFATAKVPPCASQS